VDPIYESFDGWSDDLTSADRFDDLPDAAQNYLKFVSAFVGVPISMISTGPKREQIVTNRRESISA
jgi:adenylosuccinate synthase